MGKKSLLLLLAGFEAVCLHLWYRYTHTHIYIYGAGADGTLAQAQKHTEKDSKCLSPSFCGSGIEVLLETPFSHLPVKLEEIWNSLFCWFILFLLGWRITQDPGIQ